MRKYNIANRWKLLAKATGIQDIENKFNAYDWYQDSNLKIHKNENYYGWYNSTFDFITIWPLSSYGIAIVSGVKEEFVKNGYTIVNTIQNGVTLEYNTMTDKEITVKVDQDFRNGGRMSD